jgi:hypothetical protein
MRRYVVSSRSVGQGRSKQRRRSVTRSRSAAVAYRGGCCCITRSRRLPERSRRPWTSIPLRCPGWCGLSRTTPISGRTSWKREDVGAKCVSSDPGAARCVAAVVGTASRSTPAEGYRSTDRRRGPGSARRRCGHGSWVGDRWARRRSDGASRGRAERRPPVDNGGRRRVARRCAAARAGAWGTRDRPGRPRARHVDPWPRSPPRPNPGG